jgi:hypothetical protein
LLLHVLSQPSHRRRETELVEHRWLRLNVNDRTDSSRDPKLQRLQELLVQLLSILPGEINPSFILVATMSCARLSWSSVARSRRSRSST